jgi:hypothetical protein
VTQRIAAILMGCAALVACSAPRTPLPSYSTEPGASPGGVVVDGRIGASPNSPCLELTPTGYPPIALAWPPGYSATFQPLRVYDPAGTVVAAEGDEVEVSGMLLWQENPGCKTDSTLLVIGIGPKSEDAN